MILRRIRIAWRKEVVYGARLHFTTRLNPMLDPDAEALMARLRWPSDVHCPCCGHDGAYRLNVKDIGRPRYKCRKCRRQFSVTKGTMLEGVRVPLCCWVSIVKWATKDELPCKKPCDLCSCANVGMRAADNAIARLLYAQNRDPLRGLIRANTPKSVDLDGKLSTELCVQNLNWQHVLTALLRTPPPNG